MILSNKKVFAYVNGKSLGRICLIVPRRQLCFDETQYRIIKMSFRRILPLLVRNIATISNQTRNVATASHDLKSVLLRARFAPTLVQTRGMFVQTQETPNPNSLKFLPGCEVLEEGQ